MALTIVKQYSVFLLNEPGALKNFAELFVHEQVDIIAMAQDVRYDAAVVRVAVHLRTELTLLLFTVRR